MCIAEGSEGNITWTYAFSSGLCSQFCDLVEPDFYKNIQKKIVTLKISKDEILQSMSDRRPMMALFVLHAHRLFSTVPTYVSTSVSNICHLLVELRGWSFLRNTGFGVLRKTCIYIFI